MGIVFAGLVYGTGRMYFSITGGFTESNIASDYDYDPRWETHLLSATEKTALNDALNQDYYYLGKGCQSYVFASEDGNYVIKFFKFQRFRPQFWLTAINFIPAVKEYQINKAKQKKERLDNVFTSWKIAYENLQPETGVLYVHLNKSTDLQRQLTIYDKIGLKHTLDIDNYEFMIQRRATMLADSLHNLMAKGQVEEAQNMITYLYEMLLSEYLRGFADNDHAIMQNTGILENRPIHIDVGQFIRNDIVKDPKVFMQEMFDKTFKLKEWLDKWYPELATFLEGKLLILFGPDYYYKAPYVHKGDVGKIPNQVN